MVRRSLAVGAALVVVVFVASCGVAPGRWTTAATPSAGPVPRLVAIDCASDSMCMTVGSGTDDYGTGIALRWNGTSWSTSISASSARGARGQLTDVACPSASSCVAVGGDIAQWDGSTWRTPTQPALATGSYRSYEAVSCASTTRCLAVGATYTPAPPDCIRCPPSSVPFAFRLDGAAWTPVGGLGAQDRATDVSCPASGRCVVIGTNQGNRMRAWAWTSGSLTALPHPVPFVADNDVHLEGIDCATASHCLVVGDDDLSTKLLRITLDGTTWTAAPPQATPQMFARGVSCRSATTCMDVRSTVDSGAASGAASLLIDGDWKDAVFDEPAGQQFTAVSCTAHWCTAVGSFLDTSGHPRLVARFPLA